MKKYKIVFIILAIAALVSLVAVTGIVYASPQTTVTPNCSGGGNNNQQLTLQLDDEDQTWGPGVNNTWSASNMAPGQTYAFTSNFVGILSSLPSTALVTCDYKDIKGIPDQMAQKMILTKCMYNTSLWSIDCLTGNWQIFAPASTGNISNWKLTDFDKDGFVTLYDLEKSPLNYLPLPSSSVTNSTKLQISVEFAPTAGNNLQSDSLNMNMDFTATSWDKSSSIGGISPTLMQSFLGQPTVLATTCTSVTSSQNPSTFGQPVTFTANVTAQSGTPTGSVQFQIDNVNFGSPVTLTNGSANSTAIATLSVGNHTVTAIYSGDTSFVTSTGTLCGGQTVKPVLKSTSTAVSSSPNPSAFNQSVTFTANVTGSGGTPMGKVQFAIDGNNFGSPVSLINGSASSAAITSLSVGNHTVTAAYSGDGNYATSNGSLAGGQTVKPVLKSTSTVVGSSLNPSVYGQSVTFTAIITGAGVTPTGTVQFKVDGSNFGSPVNPIKGSASSPSTTSLSVGNHIVTAVYSGDSNYATSTGNLTGGQTVNPAIKSTATSVSSSKNPSDYKQSVTFTATVTGSGGTPSGTVQFKIDGANFGNAVPVSKGIAASAATNNLSVGTHTVTAIYSGDTNFATSTGTLSGGQKVHGITTITWPYKPGPCNWGHTCTFKVQLGWQGSGNPTGHVTFYDGSNSLGNCNLSSDGSASFSIGNLGIGNHNITAVYNGDDNNDGSTSNIISQVISK